MDSKLLELLVCPVSKTSLVYMREHNELWCAVSKLAYSINDGIPSLLPDEARELSDAELERGQRTITNVNPWRNWGRKF